MKDCLSCPDYICDDFNVSQEVKLRKVYIFSRSLGAEKADFHSVCAGVAMLTSVPLGKKNQKKHAPFGH